MAKTQIATLLTIIFLTSSSIFLVDGSISYNKEKRITHMHFYLHEQMAGANATETAVAFGGNNSVNPNIPFGLTTVFDYLLTETHESSSEKVGKSQGLLALSSQNVNSITMAMAFVFSQGKYNGSSVSILGQNNLSLQVRELPIVGGTGLFRFARGYCKTSYYAKYPSSNYYIFEWDLYIYHDY
ncbi:dirigent protein 22-like [Rutidosis leptorrhynchoides]|uniref:dirigent protein 22-like n=1 Tax=Rutidosis leptorrhynchoides TaxID=125765 RepID=UPI003A990F4D